MTIDNLNLNLRRKAIYIPVEAFNGWSIDGVLANDAGGTALLNNGGVMGQNSASNLNLVGGTSGTDKNFRRRARGNGNPRLTDIAGLNMTGMLVAAANDGVEGLFRIPNDLDRKHPVGISAWWTSEAAAVGARTITWKALYTKYTASADGDAAKTAGVLAAGGTALNTVIAAQAPSGTSKQLQQTARGIINADTFTQLDCFVSVLFTMSAFNAALVENKYLLGVEVDYVPYVYSGRHARRAPAVEVGVRK